MRVTKMIVTTTAAALVAAGAFAGAGASIDVASAYVFRGATINDGLVLQPGIEVDGFGLPEEYGSLAMGAWGNFNIDEPSPGAHSSEFSEIDLYASYNLPTLVEGLDLSAGYTEYTYPLGGGYPADKEVNLGAGTEISGVSLGATVNVMIGGELHGQIYADVSASYAMEISDGLEVEAGASAAYTMQGKDIAGYQAGGAEDGLSDAVLSLSGSYALTEVWSVGASIAYIAQLDDEVLVDVDDPVGTGYYDVDVVGMVGLAASF